MKLKSRLLFQSADISDKPLDFLGGQLLFERFHLIFAVRDGCNGGGVGELGVPTVAPALANAVFRLTGQRVRNLPFFPNATMGD